MDDINALLAVLKNPVVGFGLGFLAILKLADLLQRASHRRADQNGNNPVVRELRRVVAVTEEHNETMKRAHQTTQARLEEYHADSVRICKAHVARTDAAMEELTAAVRRDA